MSIYTVLLADGTIGTIRSDSINGQNASAFLGEIVNIHLLDSNGCPIEVRGELIEILEDRGNYER